MVWILAACRSGSVLGLPACGPSNEGSHMADVVGVRATGQPGAYTVWVEIRSDETGCDRYADWWELVTPDGELVFRRILNHSHPDEQPFERDGGPVAVGDTDELVVRAHLHPTGYGGAMMRGTFGAGFSAFEPEPGFAADLEGSPPLPTECWF